MKSKTEYIRIFILLQIMNIVFSLDGVLLKLASNNWNEYGLFDNKTIILIILAVVVLGIYAVLWQWVLSRVKLTVAYLSKGLTIFWGLIWSVFLFGEKITLINFCGAILIFMGTLLVNANE